MESGFDTTGVITKIFDNFCVVTITINDVPREFSFSKNLLYVFGLQCEGQMANILDEGMEVDVRYKLSNENVPCIVAVWISNKPNHLCKDSTLKPVYEQKGKVMEMNEENILLRLDSCDLTALISKEVFFRDGFRAKDGSALVEGETVTIDAIPFDSEHHSGASFQATCAWVGSAPVLVERFGLGILALDDPWDVQDPMEVVHGTVTVIPSEILAFAEVECVQHNGKVLLFRSSFAVRVGCDNIKDIVNVGDKLCMRTRYENLFAGSKQLYASQAWKDGCEGYSNEMPEVQNHRIPVERAVDHLSAAAVAAESESVMDLTDQSDEVSSQKGLPLKMGRQTARSQRPQQTIRNQSADIAVSENLDSKPSERGKSTPHTKPESIEKRDILSRDPPLSGIISIISYDEAYILYDGLKIHVNRNIMFKDGKRLTDNREYAMIVVPGNEKVFFEAVGSNSKSGFTHGATCVWVGEKPAMTLKKVVTPEHLVETNVKTLSPTIARVPIEIDKIGDTLIGDPPLIGKTTLISNNTASISYQEYKIFVKYTNMYVDEKACDEKHFAPAITTTCRIVNFEAVKLSPEKHKAMVARGFTHKATYAWVGRRPLSSMGSSISPVKPKQKDPAEKGHNNTEGKYTALSPVLFRENPPLEGILRHDASAPTDEYKTFHSVCISFRGLKVFMDDNIMYYEGQLCPNRTVLDLISRGTVLVNFEAVKTGDYIKISNGYTHEATCVWFGQRPGLITIARTLPPMRLNLLDGKDRTYRGVIHRFCLPKIAFIHETEHDCTVSLHVSAFGRIPRQYLDFESSRDCISGMVKLNDIIEFKLTRLPRFSFILSATDVKIVSTKKETSNESLLLGLFPQKSNTKRTFVRNSNLSQVPIRGITEGRFLHSAAPSEASSVRKREEESNQAAKEVVASASALGCSHPEGTNVFNKGLSDKEIADGEAKQKIANVSVRSPLAKPGGSSSPYPRFQPCSVEKGEETLNQKLEELVPLYQRAFEEHLSYQESIIPKAESLREEANMVPELERGLPSQPQKRPPQASKCTVM